MATKKANISERKRRRKLYRPPKRSYPSSDYDYTQTRPGLYQVTHYNIESGAATVDPWLEYYGPVVTSHGKQVTTSVQTPGWPRVRIKPDNPFNRKKEFRSDPNVLFQADWIRREDVIQDYPGTLYQRVIYDGNSETLGAQLGQGVPADDPYPELVSKLLGKLSDAKANTAVAMAELNKTAAHVTKTAQRLAKSYLALRHLKFREFALELGLTRKAEVKVRSSYKSRFDSANAHRMSAKGRSEFNTSFASETWLEYSYAWKPLLKDVYDHADALAQTVVERQGVMREAKAKHKTANRKVIHTQGLGLWDYDYTSADQNWQAMEVRYRVPQGAIPAVRAFGLVNPLEVAWELVPFSFVADWFIPIGDGIKNLTATVGLTFHGGWRTTRVRHTVTSTVYGNGRNYLSGSLRVVGSGRTTANLWWFEINRTILTDFPSPRFPEWRDPRGLGHKENDETSNLGALVKDSAHGLSAIALLQTVFLDKKSVKTLR